MVITTATYSEYFLRTNFTEQELFCSFATLTTSNSQIITRHSKELTEANIEAIVARVIAVEFIKVIIILFVMVIVINWDFNIILVIFFIVVAIKDQHIIITNLPIEIFKWVIIAIKREIVLKSLLKMAILSIVIII